MDTKILIFCNQVLGYNFFLDQFLKLIAVYLIYVIPVFLVGYWFFGEKKLALRAFLSGILGWCGFSYLIGTYLYFRERPFSAMPLKEFLFHRPTYSFPSDHATFLFALAFSFYLAGERAIGYCLFAVGVLVSIARVVVGFHYPSDVLAGWILGFLAAWLVWLAKRPVDRYVTGPIIWLAKKIKLA